MLERTKIIDVSLIYELWNAYAGAVQEGDLQHWISLWRDDGLQMAPGSQPRVGKEQIQAAMQATFDHYTICNMEINPEEVQILGDRAYTYGTYEFELAPRNGGESISYAGNFLDILAKQVDGSWKIAIDCHN